MPKKTDILSRKAFEEVNQGTAADMQAIFEKWREWFETGHNPKTEFEVRIQINYEVKH